MKELDLALSGGFLTIRSVVRSKNIRKLVPKTLNLVKRGLNSQMIITLVKPKILNSQVFT